MAPGSGSRRIFAPQFKLQVLDSYRKDADCRGNQRATARKYGIHRRQIQKWLQVEASLRAAATLNCARARQHGDERGVRVSLFPSVRIEDSEEEEPLDFTCATLSKRRSFSLQFKLEVLDAFHSDKTCHGNQRATARKFGINRRQVQKWLGQEGELRGEASFRGGLYRQRLGRPDTAQCWDLSNKKSEDVQETALCLVKVERRDQDDHKQHIEVPKPFMLPPHPHPFVPPPSIHFNLYLGECKVLDCRRMFS